MNELKKNLLKFLNYEIHYLAIDIKQMTDQEMCTLYLFISLCH